MRHATANQCALFWIIFYSMLSKVDCLTTVSTPTTSVQERRIQVCQNKDCCRRFQSGTINLHDTIQLLLVPNVTFGECSSEERIVVERTGCLSLCDKGPNVSYSQAAKEAKYFGGIFSVQDAVRYLHHIVGCDVPKELIAAFKVLEKASQCTFLKNLIALPRSWRDDLFPEQFVVTSQRLHV
jgi:predicted metal-binding protein